MGNGRMLGEAGFQQLVREYESLPLQRRIDTLLTRLDRGYRPLRDDITLVALESSR